MSNTTNKVSLRLCPNCGLELPSSGWEGLCPKCLVLVSVRGLPKPECGSSFPATGPEIVEAVPAAFPDPEGTGTISLTGQGLDDYHLMEEIGRGGMGVVFKARQLSLNRTVAVKILLAGPAAGGQRLERFRAEARAVAQLHHPNIVAIYGVGEYQGAPFFSMEYVAGRTLADIVEERPLPPEVTAGYVQIIAEAIEYAHENGIVHRDLKPSNVLIDRLGHLRITDFGLAKRISSSQSPIAARHSSLTVTGQVLGSPSYLAPEQVGQKNGTVGPASDIYALGAILFHLLTGRPPFLSETVEGTLLQVLTTEPVGTRRLNPAVPRDLETICSKCLQKDASRRYASAKALAEDLGRFLNHRAILARPTGPVEKLSRWCQRRPALACILVLLNLSFAAGLAGILLEWRRARESELSLQRNLYATDVNLAQVALAENNLGRATTLLQRHVPALPRDSDLRGFEWWYLWHLCRGDERATLHEGDNIISCVRFSPDGHLIASAGFDGVVTLWNPTAQRPIAHLTGLTGPVSRLALSFSPDGRLLAVSGGTNLVVWDTVTWKVARTLPAHSAPLGGGGYQLAFTPDSGRLAARLNGDIQVWETSRWRPILTVSNSVDETATLLAFSPEGKVLAAYNDRHLQFWDAATGHQQRARSDTLRQPLGLAFDQSGFRLAVIDASGMLRILDAQTGSSHLAVQAHTGLAQSVAFSPDGKVVATGGSDQLIQLWDSASLTNIATLKGHQSEVWSIAFSPDARLLASASKDGTLKLWNVKSAPDQVRTLNEESFPDWFSTDSKVLLTRRGNGSLHFWDVETGQQRRVIPPLQIDGERYFTTVSLDGKYLATSVEDGRVSLWDLQTGACVYTNRVDVNPANALAFSPGNRQLAFSTGQYLGADWRGMTGLLDLASGRIRILASEFAGTRDCACLAFSPDGKSLAGAGPDYTIRIWDLASGRERRLLRGHAWSVKSLAFSPDGKLLASGSDDNTARLWDVAAGGLVAVLAGHETGIVQVRFSPDGRTLATSGNDRTLRLWNIATQRELLTLKLATRWTHFLFSPDGRLLASGGLSGPLELWRAPAGFSNHISPILNDSL